MSSSSFRPDSSHYAPVSTVAPEKKQEENKRREAPTGTPLHLNPARDPDWESTTEYSQVGCIKARSKSKCYFGSGTLVSVMDQKDLFITAGHMVFDEKNNPLSPRDITIYFNYHKKDLHGNPIGESYSVLEIIEAKHEEKQDYAILRLAGNPSKKYGALALSSEEPASDTQVEIAHHPKGQPKTVSKGKIIRIENGRIFYALDTEHGSSGAAIIRDKKVIGIHTTDNSEQKNNMGYTVKYIFTPAILQKLSPIPNTGEGGSPAPFASPAAAEKAVITGDGKPSSPLPPVLSPIPNTGIGGRHTPFSEHGTNSFHYNKIKDDGYIKSLAEAKAAGDAALDAVNKALQSSESEASLCPPRCLIM